MLKKFARWILADEIRDATWDSMTAYHNLWREAEMNLDAAKAQVQAESARVGEIRDAYLNAASLIAKVFYATNDIKNGTGKKINRMVRDYYDAS